jgi:hypothetical protein
LERRPMSDAEHGWREMRLRVYRLDPVTGEERTVSEELVRRHPAWPIVEPLVDVPCRCPMHPGGVMLDLRGGV